MNYTLDNNYFNEINNSEKAYWVGFIFADGCVCGNRLIIDLQRRDRNILEKLRNCLKLTKNLKDFFKKIENKEYFYTNLSFSCNQITTDLKKIGINENKTKNPSIPQIPSIFFFDFLRGLTDGDGTIYFNKERNRGSWQLVCHEKIVSFLVENIKLIININISAQSHWRTNYIKILSINGNKQTFLFLSKLYNNANLYLDRKYNKYIDFIKNFISKINQPNFRRKDKSIKYKGICRMGNKFHAQITHNGKVFHLGSFKTRKEAALEYNKKAKIMLKDKAILNII